MVEAERAVLLKPTTAAIAVGAELAQKSSTEGCGVLDPGEIDHGRGLTRHAGPEAPLQRCRDGGVVANAAQRDEVDREPDDVVEGRIPFGVADRVVDDRVTILAERFAHSGQDPQPEPVLDDQRPDEDEPATGSSRHHGGARPLPEVEGSPDRQPFEALEDLLPLAAGAGQSRPLVTQCIDGRGVGQCLEADLGLAADRRGPFSGRLVDDGGGHRPSCRRRHGRFSSGGTLTVAARRCRSARA